jgi:hypothetical protein
MLFDIPPAPVFPPLVVLLSIAAAARNVALESWRAGGAPPAPAGEISPPSSLPPPCVARHEEPPLPPGPGSAASDEVAGRWADLADWRVWWNFNDDYYLALKEHVHACGALTNSDDFFLGQGAGHQGPSGRAGRAGAPAGPSTPGGVGPATPGPAGQGTPMTSGGGASPGGRGSGSTLPPGARGPVDSVSPSGAEWELPQLSEAGHAGARGRRAAPAYCGPISARSSGW